jgi:hypothetical protein
LAAHRDNDISGEALESGDNHPALGSATSIALASVNWVCVIRRNGSVSGVRVHRSDLVAGSYTSLHDLPPKPAQHKLRHTEWSPSAPPRRLGGIGGDRGLQRKHVTTVGDSRQRRYDVHNSRMCRLPGELRGGPTGSAELTLITHAVPRAAAYG